MPHDYDDVGFTADVVAASARSGRSLSAWAGLAHVSLSDASGAGVRYTYPPTGGQVCEEPILRAGDVTQVWVTHAVRDPGCVWCSVVLADVRADDGHTLTRLAFTVSDLAHTISAWRPEGPTPVQLSVWPHRLQTYSSDEQYHAAQTGTGGMPWAIGSWVPTGLFGDRATPTGSCIGRVADVTGHVNQHTGASFGVVRLPVTTLGLSVVVPLTGDQMATNRLEPGHVLEVRGRVRAAFAGLPGDLVDRGQGTPWLAQLLGLAPGPATGPPPPRPPPAGDALVPGPPLTAPVETVVVDGVLAAVACGPGRAVCVQLEGSGVVVLGVSSEGVVDWRQALDGPFELLESHDDHVVVVSGGVATVLDAGGTVRTRVLTPQGQVWWVVSEVALWALVGAAGAPGPGPRPWTVHRLHHLRWTGAAPAAAVHQVCESWELPAVSGTAGGRSPSLRLGESRGAQALVLLPDDSAPGGGAPVLVKVPATGEALVYRPAPEHLPLAVLGTRESELVSAASGTWVGAEPVGDLAIPTGQGTTWRPLSPVVLGGVVVPADGYPGGGPPTSVGVLHLSPTGPRWHLLDRRDGLADVRFVVDADREDDLVWASTRGRSGSVLHVLDVLGGTTGSEDLPGEMSVVAASGRAGAVLALVDQPVQRVYAGDGRHAVTGRSPGRLVRRRTELGR